MAQDYAIKQLENSPRHHEWNTVESNNRDLHLFVAYPEVSEKATTVIVIHENRGLNDWARSMTDQLAEAGYLAVAPDLLSGASDKYEKTSDYPTSDEARTAIYSLDQENVTTDLLNTIAYAKNIDASNGKIVVMGFCWGGSQSFLLATDTDAIEAAMVFYGTAPKDKSLLANIEVPVYGFYGENDSRVNSTIGETEEKMREYNKRYEYEIYGGAGHAYMRRGDDPEGDDDNVHARNESWDRLKKNH
jgi:carboxymethylenebutenolidase